MMTESLMLMFVSCYIGSDRGCYDMLSFVNIVEAWLGSVGG